MQDAYTLDDLRRCDGTDDEEDEPVLLSFSGSVYDVTDGRCFYGSHGVYHALTGRDATRMLAKGLLLPESDDEARLPLTPAHLNELRGWQEHFDMKYIRLGLLKPLADQAAGAAAGEIRNGDRGLQHSLDSGSLTAGGGRGDGAWRDVGIVD